MTTYSNGAPMINHLSELPDRTDFRVNCAASIRQRIEKEIF